MHRIGLSWIAALALMFAAPPVLAQTVSPLTEVSASRFCTSDGAWCVAAMGGGGFVADNRGALKPLPIEAQDGETLALWPYAIVGDASVLFGVTRAQSTMYAGGGASASSLTLVRVGDDAAAATVVLENAPWRGDIMIRACFGPEDARRRRNECHDQYRYSATLTPAANGALTYSGVAEAYPAGVRRMDDNTDRRITRRDLRWERDDTCSVTRTLTPDANGVFQFDAPLPECSDYTVP